MSVEPQPELQTDAAAHSGASIAPSEQQHSLMDVWRVLIKRRYTVLIVTVLCLAGAVFYALRTQPEYESIARLDIEPNNSSDMLLQNLQTAATGEQGGQNGVDLQTEIQILQSDSVLFRTAQELNLLSRLRATASAKGPGRVPAPSGPITAPERRAMINFIRGGLSVSIVRDTNIVEVSYLNTDPKMAAAVVNGLLETFSNEVVQLKYDRTTQVSDWLQTQLGGLQQQAADAQRQLAAYERTHGIVGSVGSPGSGGTDQNSNLTIQGLQQISASLETAEANRIAAEARMQEFDSLNPNLKALMSDNPALSALVTQLSTLETQRAELASRFGNNYPQMRQLEVEIENVQAQANHQVALARVQIQAEYKSALGVEDSLRKRLQTQEDAAYRLNEDVAQFAILNNQAELSRNLYDTLQTTLKEASVTAGLSAANITVLDSAQVPYLPVAPRKRLIVELEAISQMPQED